MQYFFHESDPMFWSTISFSCSMKRECCGLRSLPEWIWQRKTSSEPGEHHATPQGHHRRYFLIRGSFCFVTISIHMGKPYKRSRGGGCNFVIACGILFLFSTTSVVFDSTPFPNKDLELLLLINDYPPASHALLIIHPRWGHCR